VQTFLSLLPFHMLFFSTSLPSSHHSFYLVQGDDKGYKQLITIVHDCLLWKNKVLNYYLHYCCIFYFRVSTLKTLRLLLPSNVGWKNKSPNSTLIEKCLLTFFIIFQ
jgi:hypothetical protein